MNSSESVTAQTIISKGLSFDDTHLKGRNFIYNGGDKKNPFIIRKAWSTAKFTHKDGEYLVYPEIIIKSTKGVDYILSEIEIDWLDSWKNLTK